MSEERTWLAQSEDGQPTASWRWLGRRPEGPGADAPEKDFTLLRIREFESINGGGAMPGGKDGGGA